MTYTWSTVGSPPAPVAFSPNGTNAAQNAVASFTQSGQYTLQATITDAFGGNITSSVTVNVNVGIATPGGIPAPPGTAARSISGLVVGNLCRRRTT